MAQQVEVYIEGVDGVQLRDVTHDAKIATTSVDANGNERRSFELTPHPKLEPGETVELVLSPPHYIHRKAATK